MGITADKVTEGGQGSGNYGHAGIPGTKGGSMPTSRMPEANRQRYRSIATKLGFKGEVTFEGSPAGSDLMGYYDPQTGKVVICDEAWKSGRGDGCVAHEVTHAKVNEVTDAVVNEDPRVREYAEYVGKYISDFEEEGANITFSSYAQSFWSGPYEVDLDKAIGETFSELARLEYKWGESELEKRVWSSPKILQGYKEFKKAYANLK